LSKDHTSDADPDPATTSITAAVRNAEEALASLKRALKKGAIGEVGEEVAAAAAKLAREAEHLIADNQALQSAQTEFTGAIRRNPLASVGAAFLAGLLLARMTRG
jgi:hypothetical protein